MYKSKKNGLKCEYTLVLKSDLMKNMENLNILVAKL